MLWLKLYFREILVFNRVDQDIPVPEIEHVS